MWLVMSSICPIAGLTWHTFVQILCLAQPNLAQGTSALTLAFQSPGSFHRISWQFYMMHSLSITGDFVLETGDVTIENPLFMVFIANAAWALAAICMSKQVPLFVCTACRKLTQSTTKWASIVDFWKQSEGQGFIWGTEVTFGSRAMPFELIETFSNILSLLFPQLFVGHRGSVVACVTYKQEIAGSIPSWGKLCSDIMLLGKALCPHVHSFDPGVSGYLVGQWRLVCLNSSMRQKLGARLCAPQGVKMAYELTGPVTRG